MKKIIVLIIFILVISPNIYSKKPNFYNGVVDLRNFSFEKNYDLFGYWEFYWQQLLTPQQLKTIKPQKENFIIANSAWNNYTYKGKKIGHWGYATYKLTILAPKGQYSIFFHQVISAYKIWINDSLIYEHGKVGTDQNTSIPRPGNKTIHFKSQNDTITIVIQVSNFHHTSGGLQEPIFFGKTENIIKKRQINVAIQSISVGAEFMFAIFFLIIYILRRKNRNYLLFAVGIFFLIAFESVNNEAFLLSNFPNISWNLAKKIDFVSNYLRLTFFIMFIWLTFRDVKLFKRSIIFISIIPSILFAFITLIFPSKIFSQTLIYFIAFSLITFLYIITQSIVGIFRKVKFSFLIFLGMLLLLGATINDSLFSMNLVNTGYYMGYGWIGFILFFSIIFSLKFSQKYQYIANYNELYESLNNFTNDIIQLKSYDLIEFVKVMDKYIGFDYIEIWLMNGKILSCELVKKENNTIDCSFLKDSLPSILDTKTINDKIENQQISKSKNELFIPIFKRKQIKAFIYLKDNSDKFRKADIQLIENMLPYITNTIESYEYYYEIKNINENLEMIIENRTQIIYDQKEELKKQLIDISAKYEEINIINNVINDINQELNQSNEQISQKNQELFEIKEKQQHYNEMLVEKNKMIQDSLIYSKYLRNIFLKSYEKNVSIENFFNLQFSKHIISGDFYCFYKQDNAILFSLFNTTATNVVSVFLSFLLSYLIDEILQENQQNIYNTKYIAKEINKRFKTIFDNRDNKDFVDSFKVSLCTISFDTGKMSLTLIGQDLIIIRKGEMIKFSNEKLTIGGLYDNFQEEQLQQINFDLKNDDLVYMYTEGVWFHKKKNIDQEQRNFERDLLSVYNKPILHQKEFLSEKYSKSALDTSIIALKFKNTKLKGTA